MPEAFRVGLGTRLLGKQECSIRAACQPVASASRAPELRATAGPVDCVLTTDYVNGRNHSEASGEKLVSTFPRGPEGAEATWPGPWGFGVCQQKLPAQPLLPNPSPGETAWGRESQLGEQTTLEKRQVWPGPPLPHTPLGAVRAGSRIWDNGSQIRSGHLGRSTQHSTKGACRCRAARGGLLLESRGVLPVNSG